MATVAEIREAINEKNPRYAWNKGVKAYMLEFLDLVKEYRKLNENDEVRKVTITELLNGARDWEQYSYGGCSLIYDEDIAERLCPPSMQKKKDHRRRGTPWLDVQARALGEAAAALIRLVNKMSKED